VVFRSTEPARRTTHAFKGRFTEAQIVAIVDEYVAELRLATSLADMA
jgi:hypothetical protein